MTQKLIEIFDADTIDVIKEDIGLCAKVEALPAQLEVDTELTGKTENE